MHFPEENVWTRTEIASQFILSGTIALVQTIAWRPEQAIDYPEPMLTQVCDTIWRHWASVS